MRVENKPYLPFVISNSPILSNNGRRHAHWEYPEECTQDLQRWVEKQNHVKCLGPLPKKPRIYIAKYHGGRNINIYETNGDHQQATDRLISRQFEFAGPNRPMKEVDATLLCGPPIKRSAWEIFLKLAWMEDLHIAIASIVPELDDEEKRSCLEFIELMDSPQIMIEHFPKRIKEAFKLLGKKSTAIDNPILRNLYKAVHHKATYSSDKKEAHLMRNLLQNAFPKLDQHKGRGIPIPHDQRVLLAYDLMKELSVFLQNKCKDTLKMMGHEIKDVLKVISDNEDAFAGFQKRVNDPRINSMSPETIKGLVLYRTEAFLDPQIANLYKCSPGALKKHLRQVKINNSFPQNTTHNTTTITN